MTEEAFLCHSQTMRRTALRVDFCYENFSHNASIACRRLKPFKAQHLSYNINIVTTKSEI